MIYFAGNCCCCEGLTDLVGSSYWVPWVGETGTLKRHRATRRGTETGREFQLKKKKKRKRRVPESGNVKGEETFILIFN